MFGTFNHSDFIEYLHELLHVSSDINVSCSVAFLAQPPAIHRILASKACRSAIMFNTYLSRQECINLVKTLGSEDKTQFPFQCAHGRPSVIPLIIFQNNEKYI